MTKNNLLEEIKSGNEKVFANLYHEHRGAFLSYARTLCQLEQAALLEIYQDTMVVFYENVVSGRIRSFESSVRTYLLSIGKYKIYEQARAEKKMVRLDDTYLHIADEEQGNETVTDELTVGYKKAFAQLGNRCQRILELFYLQGKNIRQIVQEENYENENTVKAQKSRCLKQLRELVKK